MPSSERFVLPLSHDEVVYGKALAARQMPGDDWQRFANLRAYLAFMWAHPGKKLLFMGGEFAPGSEWNHDSGARRGICSTIARHRGVQRLVRDLNRLYRATPALHRADAEPEGFRWVVADDREQSVFAFLRFGTEGDAAGARGRQLHAGAARMAIGSACRVAGCWREMLNTDAAFYGGSNLGNGGRVHAEPVPCTANRHRLTLTLPPLATILLRRTADQWT